MVKVTFVFKTSFFLNITNIVRKTFSRDTKINVSNNNTDPTRILFMMG